MKELRVSVSVIPAVVLLGCSNPADTVPEAKIAADTNAPASGQAATAPSAGARTFVFGPETSSIEFVGSKVTGSHRGGFKKFEGELAAIDGRLAASGSKVVIDIASIWTDTDRLTGHLKSPDFFNVAQIPTATFIPTSVTPQGTNSLVTGNLTLHGVTKQISFPAQIQVAPEAVELQAEFFINRFDFEMKYPGKADDLIRKEVVLKLKVKAALAPRPATASKTSALRPFLLTAHQERGATATVDGGTQTDD